MQIPKKEEILSFADTDINHRQTIMAKFVICDCKRIVCHIAIQPNAYSTLCIHVSCCMQTFKWLKEIKRLPLLQLLPVKKAGKKMWQRLAE